MNWREKPAKKKSEIAQQEIYQEILDESGEGDGSAEIVEKSAFASATSPLPPSIPPVPDPSTTSLPQLHRLLRHQLLWHTRSQMSSVRNL